MRSQSLFNFFTKAADVTQREGGPRVYTGDDARRLMEQTTARANAVTKAEQDRRSRMTPQARYDEDFGYYLRNHGNSEYGGSVRGAYSTYIDDLRDQYARGAITRDDFYGARDHIRARLAEDQFNKMWEAYHAYTSPGLYGDTATSPSRMNSRMIHNGNQSQYIFTPNAADRGWNPANMTYAEFGKFFTGANGEIMKREEALAKWNQAWRARYTRRANGSNGTPGSTAVGARSTASKPNESWRGEGFRQDQAVHATYAARRNDTTNNPAATLNFKGGYSVQFNPAYVQDWTRPAPGSTGNSVGGTWYTAEQRMAYNDIVGQLYQNMINKGMDSTRARAEASRLTKLYMEDQMRVAANQNAENAWMEPQQPAAPASQPEGKSGETPASVVNNSLITGVPTGAVQLVDGTFVTPDADGYINLDLTGGDTSHSAVNNSLITGAPTGAVQLTDGSFAIPDDSGFVDLTRHRLGSNHNPDGTLVIGSGLTHPATEATAPLPTLDTPQSTAPRGYSSGDSGLLSLNRDTPLTPTAPITLSAPLTLSAPPTVASLPARTADAHAEDALNVVNTTAEAVETPTRVTAPTAAPIDTSATVPSTEQPAGTTTAPAYEAGFAHTSADDFKRQFGETATNDTLLTHYGNHAWNNMRNLQTRIIELRREGRGSGAECRRLIAQFELARKRYASIVHAREAMSQDELNGMYMPKFDWIFDAANDSSDYWRAHHASWGSSGLHGRSDYLNSMPKDLAEFNPLW